MWQALHLGALSGCGGGGGRDDGRNRLILVFPLVSPNPPIVAGAACSRTVESSCLATHRVDDPRDRDRMRALL